MFRLLSVPLVVVLLLRSQEGPKYSRLALLLVIVLQASDILDGFLARRIKRKTDASNRFGEVMDPIADKLYIGTTYILLTLTRGFSIWLTALIVSRDFLILLAWLTLPKIRTIRPSVAGKTADGLQAFLIIAVLAPAPGVLVELGTLVTLAVTVASGVLYLAQGIRALQYATADRTQ